jgi:predicted dehydrogenase
MTKIRCAVIGAGWWSTAAHIPALLRHPRAELVAVQKRNLAEARKVADDFGIPSACSTVEEVLAIEGLQAVVIGSTPNVHFTQARAAIEKGMHVLIEKPMTMTAAEAEDLVALAARRKVHFLISCPWHYTSHAIMARRLIQSGELGNLKLISVLMTNFTEGLYQGLPWEKIYGRSETLQNAAEPYLKPGRASYSDPAIAGGGQIYCQVSHVAAHLGFITGRQPAEVFARFDNGETAVDVYDILNIKFDDGTLVALASAGITMLSRRDYEIRVYGTKGMLLLDLWKGKMEQHDLDCNVRHYPDLPEAEIYPMFAPVENLIDTILGRAENGSPASLGLFSMKVIEAACRSARTNANIQI